jgi:hypothetical protein
MRIHNIVLTGLITDRLVAYEELERDMNDKMSVPDMVYIIKRHLRKIVKLNAMIDEWQQIIQSEVKSSIEELTEKVKESTNE